MLRNSDIHRHYFERANATIRKMLIGVLVIIGVAAGVILNLVSEVQRLERVIDTLTHKVHTSNEHTSRTY